MNKTLVVGTTLLVAAAVYVLQPLLFPARGGALTLYCSVDQDQSQPVVAAYRAASGKAVDLVGETEANRSVGITKRLEAEREHPVADVLWANEIMNTVALADLGVFAPMPKDLVEAFPERWRDPKGRFVSFAGRARILLVNTKLLPDPTTWPTSVADLLDPRFGAEGKRAASRDRSTARPTPTPSRCSRATRRRARRSGPPSPRGRRAATSRSSRATAR